MPEWISVKDRLPKDGRRVLVFIPVYLAELRVNIGKYSSWRNIWYVGDMCGVGGTQPTHWMPLPEPPKEAAQ